MLARSASMRIWDCGVEGEKVDWDKAPMVDFANVIFFFWVRNGGRKLLQSDLEVISER
jgi:hypothetical protein